MTITSDKGGASEAQVKGEKRAFDEIASVLCECHFTDGFCNGRDQPDCRCNKLAAAAVAAIKMRGVKLTWSPTPNADEGEV